MSDRRQSPTEHTVLPYSFGDVCRRAPIARVCFNKGLLGFTVVSLIFYPSQLLAKGPICWLSLLSPG